MNEDSDDDLLEEYTAAYRAANGSDPTMRHAGGRFYLLIRAVGREQEFTRERLVELTALLRVRAAEGAL